MGMTGGQMRQRGQEAGPSCPREALASGATQLHLDREDQDVGVDPGTLGPWGAAARPSLEEGAAFPPSPVAALLLASPSPSMTLHWGLSPWGGLPSFACGLASLEEGRPPSPHTPFLEPGRPSCLAGYPSAARHLSGSQTLTARSEDCCGRSQGLRFGDDGMGFRIG